MLGRRLGSALLMGVVSCFAFAACSDDDESSSSGFVSEYCDLMMRCCSEAGYSSNPSQCKALLGALTSSASYSASNGEKCLAAMRAASSHPDFCKMDDDILDDGGACEKVFSEGGSSGSVQPGGECESDSDCADSAQGEGECYHYWEDSASYQVCVIIAEGQAGSDPCIGTRNEDYTSYEGSGPPPEMGYVCDEADGLYCDSTSRKCVAFRAVGESCSYSERCGNDAYCNSEGVCAARLSAGSPCTSTYGDECVETAYCDEDSMTCKQKLEGGAPCTSSDQCLSDWCVNDKCDAGGDFGMDLFCSE